MSPNVKDQGIVLICDQDGTVLRVVRDDLGLSARVHAGSHVNDLVDLATRRSAGFWRSYESSRPLTAGK